MISAVLVAGPALAQEKKVDPKLVTRPKGTKLVLGDKALGERLWKDTKLSTNGLSCATCHTGNAGFNATFAKPYPHPVAMAKEKGGVKQVNVDEMVQFCMVVPMAAKPLQWDSKELAALSAYVPSMIRRFTSAPKPSPRDLQYMSMRFSNRAARRPY